MLQSAWATAEIVDTTSVAVGKGSAVFDADEGSLQTELATGYRGTAYKDVVSNSGGGELGFVLILVLTGSF